MKVGIIDFGVGNLGSIARALEQLRAFPIIVDRALDIHGKDALILPGVGNFTECMDILQKGGWVDAIKEEVEGYNRPLLGICLGMQLLADYGSEGALNPNTKTRGLGLIPGNVVSLASEGCKFRIPHVGWNQIKKTKVKSSLLNNISDGTDFYFVHSYVFLPEDQQTILSYTDYGITFVATIGLGQVFGTQFHPEKSSKAGMQVLYNFLNHPQC